jgi:hypothetical protein
METKEEGRFDKLANEVISPIMQKIYEAAFECIETYKPNSDEPVIIPMFVKEGVLEGLDQVIEHCESQASHYDSASVIGFALGKDGLKPGRQFRGMAETATALRNLIAVKNEQIKAELSEMGNQRKHEQIAAAMGF